MTASGSPPTPAIGFLTVIDGGEHGALGGYLVLNTVGRPLEFHCTAPVKANRAQEILFGPTLEPFLHGEQIGRTLVEKSKLAPLFICTDLTSVLAVRPFIKTPVALIAESSTSESASPSLHQFSLGGRQAAVESAYAEDEELIQSLYGGCDACLDLAEPFERIREAVEEAKRGRRESRAA